MIPQVKLNGGSGAVLRFSPPLGPSIPGTATVNIYDATDTATDTGETATIVGLNLTASNNPTVGTRDLTMTDASGCEMGHRLWIGSRLDGPIEPAQVLSVNHNNNTLVLVEGLRYSYTAPGIRGADMSLALNSLNCLATVGTYRSEWSWKYESTGDTYYGTLLFQVVKRVFQLPLAPSDLQVRIPLSLRRAAKEVLNADLLRWAERHVVHDLRARMFKPELVVDLQQFDRVGVAAAEVLLATRWASVSPTEGGLAMTASQERYNTAWANLHRERLTWYDVNDDDVMDPGDSSMGGRRYLWLDKVQA